MRHHATATFLLLLSMSLPAFASDDGSAKGRKAADVRAAVAILGVGKDAQVALILRGRKQKSIGFVEEAGEDSFQLGDFCTDDFARIPYDQVESLWGKDAVTGQKVSVGVGFLRKLRGTGDPTRDLHCGGTIIAAPPDEPDQYCPFFPFPLPGAVCVIMAIFVLIGIAGL